MSTPLDVLNLYDQVNQMQSVMDKALHANDLNLDAETIKMLRDSAGVSNSAILNRLDQYFEDSESSQEEQIKVLKKIAVTAEQQARAAILQADAAEKHAQSAEAQVKELKAHNQTFEESLATMQKQLDMQKQDTEAKAKEDKKNFKLTIFWNVFNSIVAIVPIIIDIVTRMSS